MVTDERELLDDLMRSLRAQTKALVAGDGDQAIQFARQTADLLDRVCSALPALLPTQREPVEETLHQAQRLNNRNAEILAARMAMGRARTDALLHAASAPAVYSAQGLTQSARI